MGSKVFFFWNCRGGPHFWGCKPFSKGKEKVSQPDPFTLAKSAFDLSWRKQSPSTCILSSYERSRHLNQWGLECHKGFWLLIGQPTPPPNNPASGRRVFHKAKTIRKTLRWWWWQLPLSVSSSTADQHLGRSGIVDPAKCPAGSRWVGEKLKL